MMRRLWQNSGTGFSSQRGGCGFSRVGRVLAFSSETLDSSSSSAAAAPAQHSLSSRILPLGKPGISVVPVLDQWVEDGKPAKRNELRRLIRLLRQYGRHKQALEISEWMTDKRFFQLTAGEVACRLDLISIVHGLEQAENYFNELPDCLRGFEVYGALLNCYAYNKSLEKAEATMQTIKELGFARTSLPYNVMLNLYSKVGQLEKVSSMVEEMESKGISCDKFTHCIRLNAYAATADIESMEELLLEIEASPQGATDWNTYLAAANGFLKCGYKEKALTALKKSESHVRGKIRTIAYNHLLTLYAATGEKDEVYRIWNMYKDFGNFRNSSYNCMINSLLKLDDIGGAVKIWEEWESKQTDYDFRNTDLLILAYCKKGLLGKAEALIKGAVESGKEPPSHTWDILATGYANYNQMEKAVEATAKTLQANPKTRRLNSVTFEACLKYLKEKGRIDAADELANLWQERGGLPVHSQIITELP